MHDTVLASSRVNLKLLQTFVLVARHQSFRHAADDAKRSQAAITLQIKQLESQLGVLLFYRTTRSVSLTPEGDVLYQKLTSALDQIELGLQDVISSSGEKLNHLRIACAPIVASTVLPPILSAYAHDFPDVDVSLLELKSAELYQCAASGDVDFAIGPEVQNGDVSFSPMFSERIFAVGPVSWFPGGSHEITLSDLAAYPTIQFYQQAALSQLIKRSADAANIVLGVNYHCIQGHTILGLSEAGTGVGIVTESLARRADPSQTQVMRITNPSVCQAFGLILNKSKPLSGQAKQLVDRVLESTKTA